MSKADDHARASECEDVIGYTFTNTILLLEALQANGPLLCSSLRTECYIKGNTGRYCEGNMRLAVVGDRILDFLLALKWYPTWEPRGQYNALRNSVTTNTSLNQIGVQHGLSRYITVANGESQCDIAPKTMSATIEALVGAAYLDGGMDAAKMVVRTLGIDVCDDEQEGDSKS
ncbi:MAG: hypothetical protein Q9222_007181 [Ikaeria aurantiellina]